MWGFCWKLDSSVLQNNLTSFKDKKDLFEKLTPNCQRQLVLSDYFGNLDQVTMEKLLGNMSYTVIDENDQDHHQVVTLDDVLNSYKPVYIANIDHKMGNSYCSNVSSFQNNQILFEKFTEHAQNQLILSDYFADLDAARMQALLNGMSYNVQDNSDLEHPQNQVVTLDDLFQDHMSEYIKDIEHNLTDSACAHILFSDVDNLCFQLLVT